MASSDTFDLVILGGGTGGYSCALRAAGLGLSVALVEKEKVGGTCLHWGCIPTKAFLQAAEVADHASTAGDYGVNASFDGVDMEKVLDYKGTIVDANWKGLQGTLKSKGVEIIAGTGHVTDAKTLTVQTGDGERTLTAERALVLATGSLPKELPIDGAGSDPWDAEDPTVITSDGAMYLKRVPKRPIVLGASAVGIEFASVWHSYGAEQVTVVESLDAVVPREDTDTSKALAKDLKKQGIDVKVSTTVTGVTRTDDGVTVTAENKKGEEVTIEGDLLMVAIGRRPVTEDMGFSEIGVELDRGFVVVDEWCQTAVEGVYAIGDIIPTLGLAHASFAEGMLVAERVAGEPVNPIDYAGVPRVYYCHPEIGSVGYTEQELTDDKIEFDKKIFPFSHNARAMMSKGSGHVKVLAEKDNGRVLGIHIIGPKATDLIAEGQLIYNWEALPTDVAAFVHAHPTLSEAIGEAHLALAGRDLHG